MKGDLTLTAKGHIENSLSGYQPSQELKELTQQVKIAYEDGNNVMSKTYEEFNNRSFIQRANEDQRAWLSWTPDPYEGEEEWRWNGVRPITRNRVISVAAHLTAKLIIPRIFAQNEFDEEDREAADVMRQLVEYNIRRSNYETAFLFGVISGLVNPLTFFEVDYNIGYQEIWNEDKREKVIDDVFSGFQNLLVPMDEILFENPHQYEWQKQDWIIKKQLISYGEAEAKWGEHDNWEYVIPGRKVILHEDNLFYDVEDENDSMVEEVVYKNRRKDIEVPFVGGVYMGDPNHKHNPFAHRNNKNKPKYNTVKFGYEPIDAMRFIGYKSLVAKISNDQYAADREWQMYFDATTLATFPPTITVGAGKLDRSVLTPAWNTDLPEGAEFRPFNYANPGAAKAAMFEAERSINETSQDPQLSGIQGGIQKTAKESILLQQNALTNMGVPSKIITRMVKEIGDLMVEDIIRYQTVGEVGEIVGEMSYKTFLLDNQIKEGRSITSVIRFTDKHSGEEMTKRDKIRNELKLFEEAGENRQIYEVNPGMFSKLDFLITIEADEMLMRNDSFERAFKLETYDRAIQNPLIQQDPESLAKITRDFLLEPLMKGEAAKYMPQGMQKAVNQLVPGGGQDLGMSRRVVQNTGAKELNSL